MMVHPDAMIAAASEIGRCWGHEGYRIETVVALSSGVLLQVFASDGGRFWVGATRYGNTIHAEDRNAAEAQLAAKIREEVQA